MKKRNGKIIVITCILLLSVSLTALAAVIFTVVYSKKNIDLNSDELMFSLAKGSTVTEYYYDRGANAYYLSEYDPVLYKSVVLGENKKRWVELKAVPQNLINGFLAMEDRKFYSHSGVDIIRTLYALFNSVFHVKNTFGASTVTQQVIKNISGDNEVTLKRKFNEIIRAYNIEKTHTKNEILEVYLNIIPFGENITGVSFAAENYFGKDIDEINLSEAATLVGITNAPTKYNPRINPEACLKKRNDVLFAMLDFGVINAEQYKEAIKDELKITQKENVEQEYNSWFIETVNNDVIEAISEKYSVSRASAEALLINGGLKIYTTEDPYIQEKLEDYFENEKNFSGKTAYGLNYAMAICDSVTGNLVGIVGSMGEKRGNRLLNLATCPHTPGSSLKPLALYAPLINEKRITWATVFDDVPIEFNKIGNGYVEYPKNYPSVYDGLTTVNDALRLSKNTVAIRLYKMLGAEKIYKNLKNDFNFDTLTLSAYDKNGNKLTDLAAAPLALGQLSYGVSLRRMTEAYTVFPREGLFTEGRSFIAVFDSDGNLIIDNSPAEKELFTKEAMRVMNQMLMNVTENGTASKITLKNTVDTAGKTGTSGDDKDRLFIGYTPYYTAGIWCGYINSDSSVGSVYPTHLKIWDDIMKDVHDSVLKNKKDSEIKSFSKIGLIKRDFCCDSGKCFTEKCKKDPRGDRCDYGFFIKGTEPKGDCKRHIICKYDVFAEGMANESCPEEDVKDIALLLINDRHFPKEIIISDADYVYMKTDGSLPMPESYDVPFYYNYIEEGDYVGRGKRKKQFNSYCFIHGE
ncbi:MAG: transglycosylase domain-containing protein [Clostridia bacterium]|nr:transglycosylase domain-containing protein [Clostridia bacterium]